MNDIGLVPKVTHPNSDQYKNKLSSYSFKINTIETVRESVSCRVLKCHRRHCKATLVLWELCPGSCLCSCKNANEQR